VVGRGGISNQGGPGGAAAQLKEKVSQARVLHKLEVGGDLKIGAWGSSRSNRESCARTCRARKVVGQEINEEKSPINSRQVPKGKNGGVEKRGKSTQGRGKKKECGAHSDGG